MTRLSRCKTKEKRLNCFIMKIELLFFEISCTQVCSTCLGSILLFITVTNMIAHADKPFESIPQSV